MDGNRTQQASLGCGSLILIALIVLIFSGRGTGDLEREVRALRAEVGELKKAVEAQGREQSVQLHFLEGRLQNQRAMEQERLIKAIQEQQRKDK
jgi:Sec-independent protein translocase protein TatA